jgi:hypothetical protein
VGKLPDGHAGVMPDGGAAVPKFVRRVEGDLGGGAGASRRGADGVVAQALEDASIRGAIFERAEGGELIGEPLGKLDPAGTLAFRLATAEPQPRPGDVEVAHVTDSVSAILVQPCSNVSRNNATVGFTRSRIASRWSVGGGFASSRSTFGSRNRLSRAGFGSAPT